MGSSGKRLKTWLWAVALAALCGPAVAACSEGNVELRGPWGQARFTVEVVDTADSRAKGLMHRESLPKSAGMLFVYDTPVPLSFWMRNTLIELDLIFVDARGVVSKVHEHAQPHDETLISSDAPAMAVLEVNGGLAGALGIEAGSEMRFVGFDQDSAVWACK